MHGYTHRLAWIHTHTQAKLRAKEENKTNASKNDDVQGVELQLGQEAAPKPSSGCCSVL